MDKYEIINTLENYQAIENMIRDYVSDREFFIIPNRWEFLAFMIDTKKDAITTFWQDEYAILKTELIDIPIEYLAGVE